MNIHVSGITLALMTHDRYNINTRYKHKNSLYGYMPYRELFFGA